MKKLSILMAMAVVAMMAQAKTLVVYYSYTNNIKTVVSKLQQQINADVLEVQPAQEGVQYDANGYSVGKALIDAINSNPTAAESYPAIKTSLSNLADYNTVIIAAPLWWGNMAAIMQTFLFTYGSEMAGKNVGLIVSSASSGISGVESDARRLVPGAKWLSSSLHVRSSQSSSCDNLISSWLESVNYTDIATVNSLVATDATPVSETIYSLDGKVQKADYNGPSIVRTTMSDGTTTSRKVVR